MGPEPAIPAYTFRLIFPLVLRRNNAPALTKRSTSFGLQK
jgi:hypothetical protein